MTHQTASGASKNRVFVVDDHPIVRQGLALLINREPDLTVCGEAEESAAAMQQIPTVKPDILIVDISLNGPDGLDLLRACEGNIRHSRCSFFRCTTSRFMPNARYEPVRTVTS